MDLTNRTQIDVSVNIEALANVTCDIYNDKISRPRIEPSVMHALFFDQTTDDLVSEAFISKVIDDGNGNRSLRGEVSLMPGDYKMLIYDFSTESTIVENYYFWNKCRAYTEEISPALKKSFSSKASVENMHIVYEPDHLVVASSENENIPYTDDMHMITTNAKSVVESYYLQIKVEGLEYVSGAKAILSGMVNSNILTSKQKVIEPQATIWFDLEKSDDKGVPVICTVFNTFGRIEDSHNELEVTFDIKTHDGRTVQKSFDISDLFLTPECVEHHWLLMEETIKIDPPPSMGGGFTPEVDDWEEENREIYI